MFCALASAGTGSHLTGELPAQMLGFAFVHLPHKGAGFTLNALLNEKRFPGAPDIPTALEQGF